jgi:hypothetical protein
MNPMKFKTALSFALLASAGMSIVSAQELITNGNFEIISIPNYSAQLAIDSIFFYSDSPAYDAIAPGGSLEEGVQLVSGWTTTGYNFLFLPEDASTATGGNGRNSWDETNMGFWSTTNGGTGTFSASPAGGNFIALDAAYIFNRNWTVPPATANLTQPIGQEVGGLTPGQEYELTFYWAAAQQYTFDGPTTEFLTVAFGSESYQTEVINLPEHHFSGWMQETVRFTATATSQTLSFLAGGGPDGLPPFVLLDGVSMQAVPEPGSLVLLGLGAAGFLLRRRRIARNG